MISSLNFDVVFPNFSFCPANLKPVIFIVIVSCWSSSDYRLSYVSLHDKWPLSRCMDEVEKLKCLLVIITCEQTDFIKFFIVCLGSISSTTDSCFFFSLCRSCVMVSGRDLHVLRHVCTSLISLSSLCSLDHVLQLCNPAAIHHYFIDGIRWVSMFLNFKSVTSIVTFKVLLTLCPTENMPVSPVTSC